ncbi:MAG TPA: hypothetical protein VHN80_21340 [Kineosporiaceae bacterium]|nr:hypothetical protein [Kineosporiaceae bacterium]
MSPALPQIVSMVMLARLPDTGRVPTLDERQISAVFYVSVLFAAQVVAVLWVGAPVQPARRAARALLPAAPAHGRARSCQAAAAPFGLLQRELRLRSVAAPARPELAATGGSGRAPSTPAAVGYGFSLSPLGNRCALNVDDPSSPTCWTSVRGRSSGPGRPM